MNASEAIVGTKGDEVETFVCAYLSIGASAITWAKRGVMTESDFDNHREPATNPEAGKIDRFPR